MKAKTTLNNQRPKLTREDWQNYSFFIPGAILIIMFAYIPMYGIVMAFSNYRAGSDIFNLAATKWVGFKWFEQYLNGIYFKRTFINTLRLSLLNLLFGFTMPIFFALLLNEIRAMKVKKTIQTISYLPHFISTVVVAGMVIAFTDMNGIINNCLKLFGVAPTEWLVKPENFPMIYTITVVWKGFGFGSILYFSTLSSIDPQLYEAARIDGANRWQQLIYVTLPSLAFIIAVQLVMETGKILQSNRDLILLLYRSSNASMSDTISTYVYRTGIESGKYSLATAVGLFSSLIGLTLTFITNAISNKVSGYGLW